MIQQGEAAPKFSLLGHDGQRYGPRSFGRKKMALVFFPPTPQEQDVALLRACKVHINDFFASGLVPVGICAAAPEELSAIRKRHELPFILLSDPNGALAESYDIPGAPSQVVPSVVLLAEDTKLVEVLRNTDPETAIQAMLQ